MITVIITLYNEKKRNTTNEMCFSIEAYLKTYTQLYIKHTVEFFPKITYLNY